MGKTEKRLILASFGDILLFSPGEKIMAQEQYIWHFELTVKATLSPSNIGELKKNLDWQHDLESILVEELSLENKGLKVASIVGKGELHHHWYLKSPYIIWQGKKSPSLVKDLKKIGWLNYHITLDPKWYIIEPIMNNHYL